MFKRVLEKIPRPLLGGFRFPFLFVVRLTYGILACLAILGLLLDGWIFYSYGYKALNSSASGVYKGQFKKAELQAIISSLDERQKKFESALEELNSR